MKTQDFFLICLVIMHSSWAYCSEIDVKKEGRHVTFSNSTKKEDGKDKLQKVRSDRQEYLDHTSYVKNEDFDNTDDQHSDEERPETDDDSSEFTEDCPFSLPLGSRVDDGHHGQYREPQKNVGANDLKSLRECRMHRALELSKVQKNVQPDLRCRNEYDYEHKKEAQARCQRFLESLRLEVKDY